MMKLFVSFHICYHLTEDSEREGPWRDCPGWLTLIAFMCMSVVCALVSLHHDAMK